MRATASAGHTITTFSIQAWAAKCCFAGCKWPAGCMFETPAIDLFVFIIIVIVILVVFDKSDDVKSYVIVISN